MIEPHLLTFLNQLEKNNNKHWFDENKPRFTKLEAQFKKQMLAIEQDLNKTDVIEKTKVFRIYRDIRFSLDKTPFKAHRSVNWLRAGATRRGSYYLKIKPSEHMIGVGFFAPEKDDLLRIRKEFEIDAQEFLALINDHSFKSTWGSLQGEQLKTAPRNFNKDHPAIELIRFKSFYFTKSFTDAQVQSAHLQEEIIKAFENARPFLNYMTSVLTTDLNGESII